MTETETPAEDETTGTRHKGAGVLFDPPADNDSDTSTGYAVYDRVLGRYVGPVTPSKPSQADIKALVGKHPHRVIKV